MAYFFLTLAFVFNGIANVLLKIASDRGLLFDPAAGLVKLFSHNVFLFAGVALFVVNLAFYILALRGLPLSVAYPLMVGMSFLIANSAATLFLQEPIAWQQVVGYALILAGVTLTIAYARGA